MRRLRLPSAPKGTLDLLLNLTNRHIHAQLVDKKVGRVILAAHTNEPVRLHYYPTLLCGGAL